MSQLPYTCPSPGSVARAWDLLGGTLFLVSPTHSHTPWGSLGLGFRDSQHCGAKGSGPRADPAWWLPAQLLAGGWGQRVGDRADSKALQPERETAVSVCACHPRVSRRHLTECRVSPHLWALCARASPEPVLLRKPGSARARAGPRGAAAVGGGSRGRGPGLARSAARPAAQERASHERRQSVAVPSRAMLPWTVLGLALSLRLARSGAERGECGGRPGRTQVPAPRPPPTMSAPSHALLPRLWGGGSWQGTTPTCGAGPAGNSAGSWGLDGEGMGPVGEACPCLSFPFLGVTVNRGMVRGLASPHWVGGN